MKRYLLSHGHGPDSPDECKGISHAIITAAMKVHSELGPGLLESAYLACLQHELMQAGFRSASQVGLPVVYRESNWNSGIEWIYWLKIWSS